MRMTRHALLLAFLVSPAFGQDMATDEELIPHQKHVLANGLDVIVGL